MTEKSDNRSLRGVRRLYRFAAYNVVAAIALVVLAATRAGGSPLSLSLRLSPPQCGSLRSAGISKGDRRRSVPAPMRRHCARPSGTLGIAQPRLSPAEPDAL